MPVQRRPVESKAGDLVWIPPYSRPPSSPGSVSVTPFDAGLTFDNAFARLPAAFYTRLRPDTLARALPRGEVRRGGGPARTLPRRLQPARPGGRADRQCATGRRGSAGGGVFRASVRCLCAAPRRRPCAAARRGRRARRRPLGSPAQGRRQDPLLPHGRRPRRAALVDPRVPGVGSHARPGHSDHARAGGHRVGLPGHPRNGRDRGRGHATGAQLRALRQLRVLLLDRAARRAAPVGRFHHRSLLSRRARLPRSPTLRCSSKWRAARHGWWRSGRAWASAMGC